MNDQPVPRLIHQTWKTEDVPEAFAGCRKSWRHHHPEWDYRLWTDADNRALIADHYPWFLDVYDAYPYHIQRVDAVRYFILHRFGGLYVDLDFEALRPNDALITAGRCRLGLEAAGNAELHAREKTVCNAWMACPPGHPFMEVLIHGLREQATGVPVDHAQVVLETTGPFMLTRMVDRHHRDLAVDLIQAELLYPLSMQEADEMRALGVTAEHRAKLEPAYAIHYHCGTWWRTCRWTRIFLR